MQTSLRDQAPSDVKSESRVRFEERGHPDPHGATKCHIKPATRRRGSSSSTAKISKARIGLRFGQRNLSSNSSWTSTL